MSIIRDPFPTPIAGATVHHYSSAKTRGGVGLIFQAPDAPGQVAVLTAAEAVALATELLVTARMLNSQEAGR